MKRKLKYLGRKPLPIRLKMAWLSALATIDKDGVLICSDTDATALMDTNPRMFDDLGEVIEAETEVPVEAEAPVNGRGPKPKTTRKAKKE